MKVVQKKSNRTHRSQWPFTSDPSSSWRSLPRPSIMPFFQSPMYKYLAAFVWERNKQEKTVSCFT